MIGREPSHCDVAIRQLIMISKCPNTEIRQARSRLTVLILVNQDVSRLDVLVQNPD